MVKLLAKWLWRAWPVLLFGVIVGLHLAVLAWAPLERTMINKLAGTAMQIIGGLIVLQAVHGHLGIFWKKHLFTGTLAWFKACPLVGRNVVISLSGSAMGSATGSASISVKRIYTTLEERVAELERQAEELRAEIRREGVALRQRIDEVRTEVVTSIDANKADLRALAEKIEEVTVGGFKQQAFGVLLAMYGAVVSVFA